MEKAFSLLETKVFEESADHVEITGTASTPTPDRVDDVIEPAGAIFAAEIPLLLHHDHQQPVGTINLRREAGEIRFTARIPRITEAGRLKDRVDEALHSLRYGLIKAVSIGFRVLKNGAEQMDGGGIRFSKIEIYETSLCVVPCNAEAIVSAIKTLSQHTEQPAASGPVAVRKSAGDTAPQALPRRNTVQLIRGTK